MTIKVLGTGCKNCNILERNVRKVVAENAIDTEIVKVSEIEEIINHGVMMIPALIINDKIVSVGKVLSEKDILKFLK